MLNYLIIAITISDGINENGQISILPSGEMVLMTELDELSATVSTVENGNNNLYQRRTRDLFWNLLKYQIQKCQ